LKENIFKTICIAAFVILVIVAICKQNSIYTLLVILSFLLIRNRFKEYLQQEAILFCPEGE
jgi:1,4-dihydroxy-2-naphthoate octaprenyltransferase